MRIFELEACVEGVVSDSSKGPLSTLSGRSGDLEWCVVVAWWRLAVDVGWIMGGVYGGVYRQRYISFPTPRLS